MIISYFRKFVGVLLLVLAMNIAKGQDYPNFANPNYRFLKFPRDMNEWRAFGINGDYSYIGDNTFYKVGAHWAFWMKPYGVTIYGLMASAHVNYVGSYNLPISGWNVGFKYGFKFMHGTLDFESLSDGSNGDFSINPGISVGTFHLIYFNYSYRIRLKNELKSTLKPHMLTLGVRLPIFIKSSTSGRTIGWEEHY